MVNRALDDAQRGTLRRELRELFVPPLERLGWDPKPGEGELAPQLRSVVILTLGTTGQDEDVRKEAVRRFEADEMDGDIALSILRVVASQDRPGDYETYLERHRHAATPQEDLRYLAALGGFRDEAVALDAADKCLIEFRSQDAPLVIPALMRNDATGPAVWRYVTEHWDQATARISANHHNRLALAVTTFINDPVFADEVETFHTAHPVPGGYPASVEQQLERMRVGLEFASTIRAQF
jgi:puromycin-sensitive aminopeptidase